MSCSGLLECCVRILVSVRQVALLVFLTIQNPIVRFFSFVVNIVVFGNLWCVTSQDNQIVRVWSVRNLTRPGPRETSAKPLPAKNVAEAQPFATILAASVFSNGFVSSCPRRWLYLRKGKRSERNGTKPAHLTTYAHGLAHLWKFFAHSEKNSGHYYEGRHRIRGRYEAREKRFGNSTVGKL